MFASVIVTAVIRVVLTYTSNPVTLDMYSDVVWYNMNDGAAFLGACMPTYLPMVMAAKRKVLEYGNSIRFRLSSGTGRSDTNGVAKIKESVSSRGRKLDQKFDDEGSEVYILPTVSPRRDLDT
ncbi:MAG: hypothetical protein Q9157_003762 [Trypethelium eluteriae]